MSKRNRRFPIEVNDDGELVINLGELVEVMTDDQLREVARQAIFKEELLSGVCDALATGTMFESWWYGGDSFDELRLKLKPLMPEVIAALVESLVYERDRARDSSKKLSDLLWKLERSWDDSERVRHDAHDYCHTDAKRLPRDEVNKIIREALESADITPGGPT